MFRLTGALKDLLRLSFRFFGGGGGAAGRGVSVS